MPQGQGKNEQCRLLLSQQYRRTYPPLTHPLLFFLLWGSTTLTHQARSLSSGQAPRGPVGLGPRSPACGGLSRESNPVVRTVVCTTLYPPWTGLARPSTPPCRRRSGRRRRGWPEQVRPRGGRVVGRTGRHSIACNKNFPGQPCAVRERSFELNACSPSLASRKVPSAARRVNVASRPNACSVRP
jgi:hypothetical protein